MRYIGIILLAAGVALLFFVVYEKITAKNRIISPIPESDSATILYVTPTE